MTQFTISRFVKVPTDVAYGVAADVEAYGEFLPLLQRSTIRGARNAMGQGEQFKAEMVVAYRKLGVREAFTSTVTTDPVNRVVTATSSDGPVKELLVEWRVADAVNGSTVTATVDIVLRNPLLQMAFAGVKDIAANKIMNAFEDRATRMTRVFN